MSTSVTVTGVTSSVSVTETVVEVAVQVSGLQGATGPKGSTGDVTPAAAQLLLDAQAAAGTAVAASGSASGYASDALASAGDAAASAASAGTAASSVENLAVGTTTTGAPGSSASVVDSGTLGHPILDFTVPRGDVGGTGAKGDTGSTGAAGSAATIAVGSTTTGTAGSSAAVSNSGTAGAAILDFTIPRGDVGATGATGSAGAAGSAATIAVGTVASGTAVAVVNSGSSSAAVLDFTLKTGDTGPTGPAGAVSGQVLYFDNTASDLLLPSITGTVYAAVNSNPDTITRSSGSFVTDGFVAGMKVTTSGFATGANNGTFVVTIVAANTLTLATIHALTAEAAGATVTIKADRERITRAPASGTQQDESQSIVLADGADGVTLDTYLTPSGYPGALAIPAGEWRFHGWFYVSAGATCAVKFRVIKVSATGAETTLFTTAASAAIASTSVAAPTEVQLSYTVAADIALLTTDRIAIRVIGNNSSATARTLHFVYQGSTFASHVETSLTVAGVGVPVGGAANTVLKKTSASDYDTAWSAEFATLASPTFTGTVVLPSTTSVGNVSDTELGYLDGVTSALQTQLAGKLDYPAGGADGNVLTKSGTTATWAAGGGSVTANDSSLIIAARVFG